MADKGTTVEEEIFLTMAGIRKWLIWVTIAGLSIGFLALVAAIVIVSLWKDKDKIIERDAAGRPTLLQIDTPDKVYAPELKVFVAETVPMVLDWDFAEAKDPVQVGKHLDLLVPRFDSRFLRDFFVPLRDIYLASLMNQRAVAKNTVVAYSDLSFDSSDKATVKFTVQSRTVKVGDQSATGEVTTEKLYTMKVKKGGRTIENPYGLYIYYFTESSR